MYLKYSFKLNHWVKKNVSNVSSVWFWCKLLDLDLEAAALKSENIYKQNSEMVEINKNVLMKSLTRIELGMPSPEATTLTTRQTRQRQKPKWN